MRKIKTSTPLSCFVAFRIYPVYAVRWCLLLVLLSIMTQTEGLQWRTRRRVSQSNSLRIFTEVLWRKQRVWNDVQYEGFHHQTTVVIFQFLYLYRKERYPSLWYLNKTADSPFKPIEMSLNIPLDVWNALIWSPTCVLPSSLLAQSKEKSSVELRTYIAHDCVMLIVQFVPRKSVRIWT